MTRIQNPILKGFNPDPSIIRVEDDYYIATSTFEWFPGVQIHHSKDLVNWELVSRPLSRINQLDMEGLPDSCGVWAPCLTHHDGTFYLVYSVVQQFEDLRGNTPNFLVTTKDILDDWSDPIALGNYGFDGSLFHDENGRKWFTSMKVHEDPGKIFGGIVIQEYDHYTKKLKGPVYDIFEGTELGGTEAPHIYQRNGYYYLMLAEGGTEYGHAITLARSKELLGPYEIHPENPIITSRNHPEHGLQKAGHGDLVETKNGEVLCSFLVGRPLTQHGRCTLGRETALAKMEWREDDWLYGKEGQLPPLELKLKDKAAEAIAPTKAHKDDFQKEVLSPHFQSLRRPVSEDWLSLKQRKGQLRLFGQKGLNALSEQSLIGRRVQAFHIEAGTRVSFRPKLRGQRAGLVAYYNTKHWLYCFVGLNKKRQRVVCIEVCNKGVIQKPLDCLLVNETGPIDLRLTFKKSELQFYLKENGQGWFEIGPTLDGSILSDDYVRNEQVKYMPAFTGAFVGLCCQDPHGTKLHADFDHFHYEELEDE